MSLSPVVSGSTLSEHEVVGSEDLTVGSAPHTVHGAGLEINQHSLITIEDFRKIQLDKSLLCTSLIRPGEKRIRELKS